jgi:hypothetical protein
MCCRQTTLLPSPTTGYFGPAIGPTEKFDQSSLDLGHTINKDQVISVHKVIIIN